MTRISALVLAVWIAGAALAALRGGPLLDAGLVLVFGAGLLLALLRRTRAADRAAALLAVGAWAAFAARVHSWQPDFEAFVLAGSALCAASFLLFVWTRPARSRLARALGGALHAPGLAILAFLGLLHAHDAWLGIPAPYTRRTAPAQQWPELGIEWPMHVIDNPGDLLPNGLGPADVNGDGRDDYVTNYEARGALRVAFHPGDRLVRGVPWPARRVGRVDNAESSAMGDLDGDGTVDVVAAHGVEGTALAPGVRVYWGETGPGAPVAAYTWRDGGDLPASQGGWHFLSVSPADLDGDGDLDLVAGGRASRMAFGSKDALEDAELVWAGIRWFENPGGDTGTIRDLGRWRAHAIDAQARSGHGFELGDLDGDGDLDLANANSDFDTPEAEEDVAWYANPGASAARASAWPRHELLRSDELYAKEQVLIADLDGDGWNDVIAHAPQRIYFFRNRGTSARPGERFETREIEKHPATRHRARPLEAADLDGDGALELVGALIHHDGSLPRDRAAVFWMDRDREGAWTTRVIKWGDGFFGLGPVNGEKWDQMLPRDVDGDGDLDLVADVEEYNRLRSVLAVVWFENPRLDGAGARSLVR